MLYDHLGRAVKSSELTREQAAPGLTGVRTVWDSTVASGLTPYRLANLLQGAASGDISDYLTLAEEMEERDLHYRCEISKRKLAVAALPLTVEAATDDPKDVQLADEVRELTKQAGFRGLLKDLLDAIGKGFSVCEINWTRGAKWRPRAYEWRDPRFFTFDRASRMHLRLLDEANLAEGIPLAPYKFITHLPHLKTGLPVRGGMARVAAWAYLCKNYTVKDWLAFTEVFGMPLRVGKYQAGASKEDIAVLKLAVANLGSDAAAVIPESMLIEFVESKSTGNLDLFRALADWLDAQVSRGILGQTATTQGTPGKLGGDEAQSEVRKDIRDDDAMQLAETINRGLVRPFIDLNFGPQQNYPELVLRQADQDNLTVLTAALEKLVPLGLKVEQSVIRDKFGLPEPAKDAECLGAPALAVPPVAVEKPQPHPAAMNRAAEAPPQFTPGQQALEDMADAMLAADPLAGNEELIAAAVESAASFEEAMERVLELYPRLDMTRLQEGLAVSLANAELLGRKEVQDGR